MADDHQTTENPFLLRVRILSFLANITWRDVFVFLLGGVFGGLTIIEQADTALTGLLDMPSLLTGWLEEAIIAYRGIREDIFAALSGVIPALQIQYLDSLALVVFLTGLSITSLFLGSAENGRMVIRRARVIFPEMEDRQTAWFRAMIFPGVFLASLLFIFPMGFALGQAIGIGPSIGYATLVFLIMSGVISFAAGSYQAEEKEGRPIKRVDFWLSFWGACLYIAILCVLTFFYAALQADLTQLRFWGAVPHALYFWVVAFLFIFSLNVNWRSIPSVFLAALSTYIANAVSSVFGV